MQNGRRGEASRAQEAARAATALFANAIGSVCSNIAEAVVVAMMRRV